MNNLKKILSLSLVAAILASPAIAQEKKIEKVEKKKEIIIKKDGDQAEKMVIIVDGDDITINGKPMEGSDNEKVIIMKKRLAPGHDGEEMRIMGAPHTNIFKFKSEDSEPRALLGVVTEKGDGGAKISEVSKESAAEKSGLKKDDVITKVGDSKIESHDDLVEAIGKLKPNDKVAITYLRNGKSNTTSATLSEQKAKAFAFKFDEKDFNFEMPEMPRVPAAPFAQGFSWNQKPKMGLQIQDMEEGSGVKVKEVDEESPALKAGLKEGDVITQVNGKEIKNVDELKSEIKDVKEGDTVKFTYKRSGKTQSADVKLPKKLKTANL